MRIREDMPEQHSHPQILKCSVFIMVYDIFSHSDTYISFSNLQSNTATGMREWMVSREPSDLLSLSYTISWGFLPSQYSLIQVTSFALTSLINFLLYS